MENRKPSQVGSATAQIRDFKDLDTWKFARNLRSELYRVVQTFPRDEAYGLIAQIKRAAVSVTANLAEGYGRYSYQENLQFCRQSHGSLYELRDHLTTALDAGYISLEKYNDLDAVAMSAIRLVHGYIRSTKNRRAAAELSKQ
jgi:four helix bundle protein